MRFSTVAPLAFVATLATFAAAYPMESFEYEARGDIYARDDYADMYAREDYVDMYARGDDGLYLADRDLDSVTLLARDLLYARMDRPERHQFATQAEYEKAFKSWNRRNGQILRDYQSSLAKHPHAGTPQPSDPKEWRKWAKDNRHVANHVQNNINHQAQGHQQDLSNIRQGKDSKCKKQSGGRCVVS